MSWQNLNVPMKQLIGGNAGLFVCMVLYLVWWCIVFKPGGGATSFSTACIIGATLVGIVGLVVTLQGMSGCKTAQLDFPNWYFAVGGLIVYVLIALLTYKLLQRPVTTELFLIVGWAVLELSIIHTLRFAGTLSAAVAVILIVILAIIIVASIVCYTLYYRLGSPASYFDGMVPLAGGAVFQIVLMAVLLTR